VRRPRPRTRGFDARIMKLRERRCKTRNKKRATRRADLLAHLEMTRSPSSAMQQRRRAVTLNVLVPTVLSFSQNLEETLQFLSDLRKLPETSPHKAVVDFRHVQYVGPAAGLVLAAEVYRRYSRRNYMPKVQKIRTWNPDVVATLHQIGFFDLLRARRARHLREVTRDDVVFLKYITGQVVLGEKVSELRTMIEGITGSRMRARELFRALTEAMTNVLHHAYPDGGTYEVEPLRDQWWMGASYERATRKLTVTFFDQGVGIPATLPRRFGLEALRGFLAERGLGGDDGAMIQAAMELGRTKTGQVYRGKGLLNIRSFIDVAGSGRLRIMSGRGEYVYGADKSEHRANHRVPTGGTLLDWEIVL
jgi:hypothetical protein